MGIASNIKNLREGRDMKQSELARRVGVSRSSISQWESGKTRPKMGHVERLCGALGVPVSSLISDEYYYAVLDIEPTEEERLLAAFASLDADKRKIALSTVEALAGVR